MQHVLYKNLPDHDLKETDGLTSIFCVRVRLCINCSARTRQRFCFL